MPKTQGAPSWMRGLLSDSLLGGKTRMARFSRQQKLCRFKEVPGFHLIGICLMRQILTCDPDMI